MVAPPAPSAPADLHLGTFSDDPPWLVEPAAMSWPRRVPALRAATQPRAARAHPAPPPAPRPAGGQGGGAARLGRGAAPRWPAAGAARSTGRGCRTGCGGRPSVSAPPTSSWARSSPPARASSRRSWWASSASCATRCRPNRGRRSAEVIEEDLGRPLGEVFASVDPDLPGRRVDRPGPRRHPARRHPGRRQGAASLRGPPRPPGRAGRWPGWRRS